MQIIIASAVGVVTTRLVIKPGTERNEMERNETKRNGKERQKGGLWCRTSRPDEARKTAGRQARHRVHFSWTQSNAEGVWTPSNSMLRQRDPAARLIVCFC